MAVRVKGLKSEEEEDEILGQEGETVEKVIKPPKYKLSWDQFVEWFDGLKDEQVDDLIMYLYRQWPVMLQVNKAGTDNVAYLDKWVGKKSLEELIELLGGGKYYIKVNNLQINKTIAQVYLDIPINEYDLKINLKELNLGAYQNKSLVQKLKLEGKLNEKGDPVADKNGEVNMDLVNKLMNQIENAYERLDDNRQQMYDRRLNEKNPGEEVLAHGAKVAIDMVKEQAAGGGGSLAIISQMVQTLVEVMKGGAGSNSSQTDMFKIMMEQQRLQTEIQLKAMQQQNDMMIKLMEKKNDDGDWLKQVERIAAISGMFGGGAREVSVGEKIVDKIGEILPDVLKNVGGIIQLAAASKGVAVRQPVMEVQQGNNGQVQNVAPIVEQNQMSEEDKMSIADQFVKMQKRTLIGKLQQGKSGTETAIDIAEYYELNQTLELQEMLKMVGEENILKAMFKDAELKGAIEATIGGENEMKVWIHELVTFDVKKYFEDKEKEGGENV